MSWLPSLRAAVALAVAALIVSAGSAAAAATPPAGSRVFGTRGTIVQIAADGPRVALATTKIAGACDRIVVWDEATNRSSRIAAATGCPGEQGDYVPGIAGLALAGTQVAWLEQSGGDNLDTGLETAKLGPAKLQAKQVDLRENGDGAAGDESGDYLDNLFGNGSIIAYNTWHVCDELPAGADPGAAVSVCSTPNPKPAGSDVYLASQQALWTLAGRRRTRVLHGRDARDLVAVDAGRLVVAHGDEVDVYSASGALEQTIPDPGVSDGVDATDTVGSGSCALSGNLLALVDSTGAGLDVYNIRTGKLSGHVAIPRYAVLSNLQGQLAVVVKNRSVSVVDVSTGKTLTVTAPGSGDVEAEIEKPGLFYSYGLARGRGAVTFLPTTEIARRLQ